MCDAADIEAVSPRTLYHPGRVAILTITQAKDDSGRRPTASASTERTPDSSMFNAKTPRRPNAAQRSRTNRKYPPSSKAPAHPNAPG